MRKERTVLSDAERAYLTKLYNDGVKTTEIANLLGINRTTVTAIAKSSSDCVLRRRPGEVTNTYDIDYFNTDSAESWYWTGFIAADGCVCDRQVARNRRQTLEVEITSGDRAHLENFVCSINSTYKVRSTKGGTKVKTAIGLQKSTVKHLSLRGITPRKSFSLALPCMSEENAKSYIRGYFDGDGSIYFTHNNYSRPKLSFVGSGESMHQILDIFRKYTEASLRINVGETGSIYRLSICSAIDVKLVLDWLYSNSTETTRLYRKYMRYLQIEI